MLRIRFTLLFAALAVALWSSSSLADLRSAQTLYEQGRTQEALQEVEGLLASSPADPELRFLKGIIYAEQSRTDDAIEVFAGLTQDYPELPEPYNNLAVLFAEKGEYEKAREALLAAIQTHPSYSTAHENLGDLYAKMAGSAYGRALEEDRANESARIKLSKVDGLFSVPQAELPAAAAAQQVRPSQMTPEPAIETPPVTAEPPPQLASASQEPAPRDVAATTPTPRPPTPAPAPVNDSRNTDAVLAAVERWRSAWAAQDVDGYINAYASSYSPGNLSHSNWRAQRRQRLTAPGSIGVDIDDIQVSFPSDGRADVSFVQQYRSDNYQDRVRKTLTLSLTGDGWRIVRESSQPL